MLTNASVTGGDQQRWAMLRSVVHGHRPEGNPGRGLVTHEGPWPMDARMTLGPGPCAGERRLVLGPRRGSEKADNLSHACRCYLIAPA